MKKYKRTNNDLKNIHIQLTAHYTMILKHIKRLQKVASSYKHGDIKYA